MSISSSSQSDSTPRVFIASPLEPVAGEWVPAIDANAEAERIREEYDLAEVTVTDYEHLPRPASVPHAEELAQHIEEHGEAFTAYYKYTGTLEHFEDAYVGEFESKEVFAEFWADQLGMLEDLPSPRYFDYDALKRDLFCGEFWMSDGFVFRSV